MPKANHLNIRSTRLDAYEFGPFLVGQDHSTERLGLLDISEPGTISEWATARMEKREAALRLLARRLAWGHAGQLRLGDGSKSLKFELPRDLVEYIASFAPRRGLFGSRAIDPMLGAHSAARAFVTNCANATKVRRGRPRIRLEEITVHRNKVGERQFYRLTARANALYDFMEARHSGGLLGISTELKTHDQDSD